MKTKIISTSVIALAFAMPAMATEYELNQSYNESCTNSVVGAYTGTTGIATANFTICPANSYCDGSVLVPTACPNTHPSSAQGAESSTQCYRACTTSDILHSAAVSGNMYYNGTDGDGISACVVTSCDSGYHVQHSIQNLTETIGNGEGVSYGFIKSGTFGGSTGSTVESFGISGDNTWAVDYGTGKGVITGKAVCSNQGGTGYNAAATPSDITTSNSVTEAWASNCWCQIDGYIPDGGTKLNVSAPWVFSDTKSDSTSCKNYCASGCAYNMHSGSSSYSKLRAAMLDSVDSSTLPSTESCEANTITVQWGDANGGVHATNQCTYDGTLTTPTTAPTKRGYYFTGWTFSSGNN